MFVLKVWSGGWQDVAKDESAGVLMTRAIGLGSIGDDWTIECECGARSCFYGCGRCERTGAAGKGDGE